MTATKACRRVLGVTALFFLVAVTPGCAKKGDQSKIIEVEGVVAKIDLAHGTVTVRIYSQKHKQELERIVNVTEETEILINGGLAELEDVKIGEKAVGSIKVVREGDQKRYVALNVAIERAEVLVAPDTKTPPATSDDDIPASTGA